MREILFRGNRIDNGEWVEGHLVFTMDGVALIVNTVKSLGCGHCIEEFESIGNARVDTDTVGQYTGLTDKNGKKIFEGDIVKTRYANIEKTDFVEEVVFHNGKFCALFEKDNAKMWCPLADGVPHHPGDRSAYMEWCEVIGNIHDNPELLKGGEG